MLCRVRQSSQLRQRVNYAAKKFYSTGHSTSQLALQGQMMMCSMLFSVHFEKLFKIEKKILFILKEKVF